MSEPTEASPNPPDLHSASRVVRIGGMSKLELLAELQKKGIECNDSARALFAHKNFTASDVVTYINIVELSIGQLGYSRGATTTQIHKRMSELGLSLCPLELAPHLRLQLPDQPEDPRPSEHRAPPGSITVASQPPSMDDDTVPKGFYLRRVGNVLWLRGYHCDAEHLWSAEDRFIFRARP
jgi:hypothetical protein